MATDNLGLNQSTYLVTSGADWTSNTEGNWNILDLVYQYPLVHEGEILTYDGDMLFYIP
jgi:hypothetical protein